MSATDAELIQLGFIGLFLASFLAATIVPFSSELVLGVFLVAGASPLICLLVATAGNFLGGMTSYLLGLLGKWQWLSKYFRTDRAKLERFRAKVLRYGAPTALLCWLPFVGDALAIALGFFRVRWVPVAGYMLIGKFARYLVLWFVLS